MNSGLSWLPDKVSGNLTFAEYLAVYKQGELPIPYCMVAIGTGGLHKGRRMLMSREGNLVMSDKTGSKIVPS